jgi:NAD(P)-dependent dehydrogenase (short-subunit alcohol dehydrogenase family)
MMHDERNKLAGRIAIITGSSQGLGFEVAKQFIAEGCHVMLCARRSNLLAQAQQKLAQQAHQTTKVTVLAQAADISNIDELQTLVDTTLAKLGKIDILVGNAGVYGTKGPIEEIDWDEWSKAIDINLKGTVLSCRIVLPHLKKQRYGKIILLSGGGATKPMPNLSAYAASKAAVVRFAETLSEEVKEYQIDVNTIAPGALNTALLDEILSSGPEKVGQHFYEQSVQQKLNGGTPLHVGARLCTFLASAESDGITGRLLSAVWDPWSKLPVLREQLNQSDIYTLRRIVPSDRGYQWDEPQ